MKIFAIAATALLATVAYAAPALVEARDPISAEVEVKFIGAAREASFTQKFPADGSKQAISNPLSVARIRVITPGYDGTFYGKDGSVTKVFGPGISDVGPPQQQWLGQVRLGRLFV